MKVEARFRGKTRYYPGKISRDNRDGTYDISYDDGDRETGDGSQDLVPEARPRKRNSGGKRGWS